MDFAFTDEQKMIRDTAESFLAEVSNSEAIRAAMASAKGYDEDLWANVCRDLFWQAIHIPEQFGGMGLGYVELVAMLEQMGRFLFCSPFFSTVCLGTNALLVAGTEQQKSELLPRICTGSTATLAFASEKASSGGGVWNASAVQAEAKREADGFVLNGNYRYVIDGTSADILILAARTPGTQGSDGISLFVVEANTPGIERIALPTLDQTRKQAAIQLNNLKLPLTALMGVEGKSASKLEKIIDLATIACAAEQMGGAQQVMDMAVAYTKERQQFNRTIASFQAIKHKAADMMTRVEVARSAVYYAACVAQEALDELNGKSSVIATELSEAASIAKAYCSDTYFKNSGDALQMHGGVGFTWEYDVHLYFKRAKFSEHFLGSAAYHRDRIANLVLGEISENK